jgi:NitT/TauT family transport system substrate-binding protein
VINRRSFMVIAGLGLMGPLASAAESSLRVATLRFGSLAWLLATIQAERLDSKVGLKLDIVDVATNQAGPIALLAGDVDVIVSDWTWALRQRSEGEDLKFRPFSSALGAVMVPRDSPIRTLADLAGRRLGVAGGAIDKSWLLLRAYSRRAIGKDIVAEASLVFGAAPLLTEEIRNRRLDAVLNFWPFAARLSANGFTRLLDMRDVLKALDIAPLPPLVGFVWRERLEASKQAALAAFFATIEDGNRILAQSDAAWDRIRDLVKPSNDAELAALKTFYRSGITGPWSEAQTRSAEKLTRLLIELGDEELMGAGSGFDAKLFHVASW